MEIQKCYGRTDGVKCFRRGSILRTFSLLLKRASGICQVVPDTETVNFSLATQWVSSVSNTQNCDRQCIGQQWWSHLSGEIKVVVEAGVVVVVSVGAASRL